MLKNIIFDFDGVIIDSHLTQTVAFAASYDRFVGNGRMPIEEFFNNSGNSLKNILEILELPNEMLNYYEKVSNDNLGLIKIDYRMINLLESLLNDGYKCGLCTGKYRKKTLSILKHFDINKYFKAIVCSDDVKKPKPNPESLKIIIEELGGGETVMIGDSPNDIKCAKNFNIISIGVSWGDVPNELIKREKPDYFVESIDDLKTIIYSL